MNKEKLQKILTESFQEAFQSHEVLSKEVAEQAHLVEFFENEHLQLQFKYEFIHREEAPQVGLDMHYWVDSPEKGLEVQELVSFFGGDEELSVRGAVDEFMHIDYPIFHSYLVAQNKETLFKETFYYNPLQNDSLEIGWKVYIGKLKCLNGVEKEYHLDQKIEQLYKTLFPALNKEVLPFPQAYFIKCWISKSPIGKVTINCRVNAIDWDSGGHLLHQFGESWQTADNTVQWKQNLLFIPVDIDGLSYEGQGKFAESKIQTDEMNRLMEQRIKK